MGGEKKKIPFSIAPFIAPPPEPQPRPSACYITAVWLHSMNKLIQRWLSWQQCDNPSHLPALLLAAERATLSMTRRLTCQSAEQQPQARESRSCSTDTVSHSVKGGGACGSSLTRSTTWFVACFKVEPFYIQSMGGTKSDFSKGRVEPSFCLGGKQCKV